MPTKNKQEIDKQRDADKKEQKSQMRYQYAKGYLPTENPKNTDTEDTEPR